MQAPDVWPMLTQDWLQMPSADARGFWQALARSRYARPTALRQQLALVGVMRLDLEHLLCEVMQPHTLIATIEDLVHERRLRRGQASRIEQYVLAQMTRDGRWR